jgi:CheY-like chemotaxis protein
VELIVLPGPALGYVQIDSAQLQQAILNLATNAREAMPAGGKLVLETSNPEPDEATAKKAGVKPGAYVMLAVSDTGSGMDAETRSRLFEPFFTTKENGTGLGLLSCRRIVDSHNGTMRIDSVLGEGSCFELYIPLVQPALDTSAIVEGDTTLNGNAEHVLLVVEEAGQLTLLTDTLDTWGYQVHASQSGTAALQWIEAVGLPDLVVMDADMSLFTGERTLAALSQHGYHNGVLLLCRADDSPAADKFAVPGRLRRLNKPVSTRVLLETVREMLRKDESDRVGGEPN